MANLIINDAIAARLKQIPEQENQPVDAVLEKLLEHYVPDMTESPEPDSHYESDPCAAARRELRPKLAAHTV